MRHMLWGCALLLGACDDGFTTFAEPAGVGGAGGPGEEGGAAGVGGAGELGGGGAGTNAGGAGGAPECPRAPFGWDEVQAGGCDDPLLELGLEVAPAACSACECGDWSGGACSLPTSVLLHQQPGCATLYQASTITNYNPVGDGHCWYGASSTFYVKLSNDGGELVDPGECATTGGAVEGSPWASSVGLCEGCGCVVSEGEHDCPDGFPERRVGYAAARDGRDCSACACEADGAVCAKPSFAYYVEDNSACTDPTGATVTLSAATCSPGIANGSVLFEEYEPTGGTCASPSGGEPSGAVEPLEPHTLCCARL